MDDDSRTHVTTMIKKAAGENDPTRAMHFAQAALNAAMALNTLALAQERKPTS